MQTSLTLLCFDIDLLCCKKLDESHYCRCLNLKFDISPFSVCIKSKSQIFCCDSRLSLPPDESVPCGLNLFFLNCCWKNLCVCSCCKTIEYLEESYVARAKAKHPTAEATVPSIPVHVSAKAIATLDEEGKRNQ